MATELLHQQLSKQLEHQISSEVLKIGDKLPSIRRVATEQGLSIGTVQQSFHSLERKGLIESRPKSGYFVTNTFKPRLELPGISKPDLKANRRKKKDAFELVSDPQTKKDIFSFSRGVPSPELLPVASLNKELIKAMRQLPNGGTSYEPFQGNDQLRRQIAKRSISWKGKLSKEDIVTSNGCIGAISYCLMALTQRGDTIAVESPCFFGTLQLAQSLGLKIIELPTNALTGIDLDAFRKIISTNKVKCCLFVSNFANPLGSMMPDEHKKQAVALLERYNIPLIEDDLYGDIYFGEHRPTCCKTYDESGLVLLCSSFSKSLAPGYRVGWVAPGKFFDQVSRIKMYHNLFTTTLTHEAIANFLGTGRYENHLKKFRQVTYNNYLQFQRAIAENFPEGTKISRPQGGLSIWVELPRIIDTVVLQEDCLKQKVSISPGILFTLKQQFHNCMRLGYGMVWNETSEKGLVTIGRLAKQLI